MKIKLSALVLSMALLPSCLLLNYDKISNLDLDYDWYCNIWGFPVVKGSIVNTGGEIISGVTLNVKMTYNDGTTHSQSVSLSDDIPAGGRIEFKEWLSNPKDEHPRSMTATITNAW